MIKRVVRRIAPSLSVKHATTADEVVVTFADGAITTVTSRAPSRPTSRVPAVAPRGGRQAAEPDPYSSEIETDNGIGAVSVRC